MRTTHTDDESRNEKLAELTAEAADSITQALAAGLPKTVQLIDEALGEYMQDDQARAELLKKTAAGENAFAAVLAGLIHAEAGQRAEAELVRIDERRREEERYARIEQRVFARYFEQAAA
jgi:hypothetical protein